MFSAVYLWFDIQSAAWLFNAYGYHFSFHRSMMKEFTTVSNPDFQFHLLTYDISQIVPVETPGTSTIILLPEQVVELFFFFPFSFPKGLQQILEQRV